MKEDKRIKQIQKLLDVAEGNLHSARNLLLDILGDEKTGKANHKESAKDLSILDEGKIIEGIFDGDQMIAPDGKKYPVPANYASKSKLVEGDTLKLTIAENGSLIYKQIKPVERRNLIGSLSYENGSYSVLAEGKIYKILFASVTYYKGEPGNKAAIIVPANKSSRWAALDSIIHNHDDDGEKEAKKEKKPEEDKLVLPEENKEILEEVKEKYLEDDVKKKSIKTSEIPKAQTKDETNVTVKEAVEKSAKEAAEKANNDNTANNEEITSAKIADPEGSAQERANTEQLPPTEEHTMIKKDSSAFLEENPAIEKEEKSSLGEDSPSISGIDPIKELEI